MLFFLSWSFPPPPRLFVVAVASGKQGPGEGGDSLVMLQASLHLDRRRDGVFVCNTTHPKKGCPVVFFCLFGRVRCFLPEKPSATTEKASEAPPADLAFSAKHCCVWLCRWCRHGVLRTWPYYKTFFQVICWGPRGFVLHSLMCVCVFFFLTTLTEKKQSGPAGGSPGAASISTGCGRGRAGKLREKG